LIAAIGSAVNNTPACRWLNHELNGIGLMIDYIHKDRAAIVVCVPGIELGKGTRKIVAKDLVANGQTLRVHRRHPPGLIVNSPDRNYRKFTLRLGWTNASQRLESLHILSEVKHGVTTR